MSTLKKKVKSAMELSIKASKFFKDSRLPHATLPIKVANDWKDFEKYISLLEKHQFNFFLFEIS